MWSFHSGSFAPKLLWCRLQMKYQNRRHCTSCCQNRQTCWLLLKRHLTGWCWPYQKVIGSSWNCKTFAVCPWLKRMVIKQTTSLQKLHVIETHRFNFQEIQEAAWPAALHESYFRGADFSTFRVLFGGPWQTAMTCAACQKSFAMWVVKFSETISLRLCSTWQQRGWQEGDKHNCHALRETIEKSNQLHLSISWEASTSQSFNQSFGAARGS